MTLRLPDCTRRARIVLMMVGPCAPLHLRHVPSDWVVAWIGVGPDVDAAAEALRREAQRQGYIVEAGVTVEDWRQPGAWGRAPSEGAHATARIRPD